MGFDICVRESRVLLIPLVVGTPTTIEEQNVMQTAKMLTALLCVIIRGLTLPNYLIDKILFA